MGAGPRPPQEVPMSLRFASPSLVALGVLVLAAPLSAQQGPFHELDEIEGSWINLNFQTVS